MKSIEPPPRPEHRQELARLGAFLLLCALLVGATYLLPGAEALRPWLPGEPLPLLHLVLSSEREVREDARGDLVTVQATPEPPPVEAQEPSTIPSIRPSLLVSRPPARPTPLEHPEALHRWFEALARAEAGEPGVVRTLHWGDSTIAGDGFTSRVRERLQARFGDGGPGFLPIHVDPRWQSRPGILRSSEGTWRSDNLTFAGSHSNRYGLGGIVSTAEEQASVSLGGPRIDGGRQPMHRFQVFYQHRPGGGTLRMAPRGAPGAVVSTDGQGVWDGFREIEAPEGSAWFWLQADGDGPVTVYGVALETAGPGLTWEPLGVAGASIVSMRAYQSPAHLERQVKERAPGLLVYQTGGNELGFPDLIENEAQGYKETFHVVLRRLREGAPEASCLLIAPLDQATRQRGRIVSKPTLAVVVEAQRQVAAEAGCAFWDARAAMGGEGSFQRWLEHDPPYAWTDLMHLSEEGLDLLGDGFSDAVLDAFEAWKAVPQGATGS
jgi:lysophospholipase L1-like esterase